MKEVLILSNFIPPEHSATGRIAYHVAKEMGNYCNMHLMCLSSNKITPNIANLKINKILTRYGKYRKKVEKAGLKKGLGKIFAKLSYKIYYKFANKKGLEDSKSHANILIKNAKSYIKKNNIDTLITISNPFNLQVVGYELKKKFDKLEWYPYLMDSNRHNISYKAEASKEKEIFSKAKKLVVVPALTFDKDFCLDFDEKIEVVDLPIIPTDSVVGIPSSNKKIKFIFAGMFYKDVRDPKNLLELMIRLPENYCLELYSAGCADIVKKYKQVLGDRLSVNGFISPQELEARMADAHIMLNIGNTVLNQVSSKAYDLIATGKPILNLYQNESDISLAHLRCYPLCLNVDYKNLAMINTDELTSWVQSISNTTVSYLDGTKKLKVQRLDNVAKRIVNIIQ